MCKEIGLQLALALALALALITLQHMHGKHSSTYEYTIKLFPHCKWR